MQENNTDVYAVDLKSGPFESLLPKAERGAFPFLPNTLPQREEDVLRMLCGRLLVRFALQQRGLPRETPILRGPHGKPKVEGGPEFNLSHSGEMVVCAISLHPVGVDVERIVSRHTMSLVRRFSEEERARACTLSGFYEVWTEKESVLKYLGLGMGAMRRISVGHGRLLFDGEELPCRIVRLSLREGYTASLCGEGELPSTVHMVSFDELLGAL